MNALMELVSVERMSIVTIQLVIMSVFVILVSLDLLAQVKSTCWGGLTLLIFLFIKILMNALMELQSVGRMSTATIQLVTMSVIVILVSLDLRVQVY